MRFCLKRTGLCRNCYALYYDSYTMYGQFKQTDDKIFFNDEEDLSVWNYFTENDCFKKCVLYDKFVQDKQFCFLIDYFKQTKTTIIQRSTIVHKCSDETKCEGPSHDTNVSCYCSNWTIVYSSK